MATIIIVAGACPHSAETHASSLSPCDRLSSVCALIPAAAAVVVALIAALTVCFVCKRKPPGAGVITHYKRSLPVLRWQFLSAIQ